MRHTEEHQRVAVQLVEEWGAPLASVAQAFMINPATLRRWRQRARQGTVQEPLVLDQPVTSTLTRLDARKRASSTFKAVPWDAARLVGPGPLGWWLAAVVVVLLGLIAARVVSGP